jgi:quercetin dioxygenase-like cupin family protein
VSPLGKEREGRVAVQDSMERIVVAPQEGKTVDLGGLGVVFKVWGEDTGGAFSVVEHPMEPGRLVPPHTHDNEHESFLMCWRASSGSG